MGMHHPLVEKFNEKQIAELRTKIEPKEFNVGDTLRVEVVSDSEKKSITTSQGVCISKTSKGIASSFVIRRLEKDCEIKMRFPVWGEGIRCTVVKRGKVRRAKLYYLERVSRKKGEIKQILPSKKIKGDQ
jgi:large subunit ribosomal protein L19